jgi:cell division protein DivIC
VKAKVFYLAIIVLGLGASFGLAQNLYNSYQNSQLLQNAREKLERLRIENSTLKESVKEAENPNFIEKEARERLGLVKPGEVVVILPEKSSTSAAVSTTANDLQRPIWKQWWGLFFGG